MLSLKRHHEARSQNCESNCSLPHVCLSVSPPVHIELGSNWTGFMRFDI